MNFDQLSLTKKENTEEYWNIISHFWGLVLSMVGGVLLLQKAAHNEYQWASLSAGIFITSMIMVYAASSLYHYHWNKASKNKFRILDHICIYYLIAGSYTPFMVLVFDQQSGIFMLKAIWGIAFFGTIFKLFFTGKFEIISIALYLAMGWLAVFEIDQLITETPRMSLIFIGVGGVAYTIGAFIYAIDKIKFNHVIWHVFVLMGSFFHYLAVYNIL